jgi:hypothetical protein
MSHAISRSAAVIRTSHTDANGRKDHPPRRERMTHNHFGRKSNVKLVEPPSCSSASPIVFIGKNSRGNWVAQQQNGLYGGLFVSRVAAVRYALFENGNHPEAIVAVSREIELDMGGERLPRRVA